MQTKQTQHDYSKQVVGISRHRPFGQVAMVAAADAIRAILDGLCRDALAHASGKQAQSKSNKVERTKNTNNITCKKKQSNTRHKQTNRRNNKTGSPPICLFGTSKSWRFPWQAPVKLMNLRHPAAPPAARGIEGRNPLPSEI